MTSSTPMSADAPTAPSAPASARPSAPAPSTAPAPRSRRWVTPVVAIVVAAVVIIAVLAVAGLIFHKASSNTTESYATLDEAESVAGPAAAHAISGSWSVLLAAGLRLSAGVTLPTANLSSLENFTAGCNLTTIAGAPPSLTVDATPVSAPPGHAAFWVLGLTNGAGTVLLVVVDLGVPAAFYTLSGSTCGKTLGAAVPFPPTESDSPALVAAANGSGGSTFLARYPSSAQLMLGIGGVNIGIATTPPFWEVVDTSCPVPLILNETGAEFNATLTGAPANVVNHSTGPVNCALGLGNALSGISLVAGPLLGLSKAI